MYATHPGMTLALGPARTEHSGGRDDGYAAQMLSGGPGRVLPAAHPVAGHPHLDVPVALVAAGAFLLVLVVGMLVPRRDAAPDRDRSVRASWHGELRSAQWVVRGLSLGLLVLGGVAGRAGIESELENLAPALLVGAAWPLVFLGALVLPGFWRWLDPWDTLGRAVSPRDRSAPGHDVRPAIPLAVAVLWYLSVFSRPLEPGAVGLGVAAYTVIAAAGCIARGRRRWLSTAEPVGIVLNTLATARPGRASDEDPPRGLHALLGVLAGGTLVVALRRTELWSDLEAELSGADQPQLLGTAGLLVCCALGAGLVVLQGGLTRTLVSPREASSARQAVVLAAAPAVAGMVVAVGMARNRLSTSVQLLPGLLGDPFGRGWDLLGEPTANLDPAPLGAAGLLAAQLTVLVLATLWGAVLVARLLGRQDRLPAVLLAGQLVAAGVAAVALH